MPEKVGVRDWVAGSILFLAVVLVYQPVWHAGFIWDDGVMITENPCIVGPLGLKEIWTTDAANICPLVLTTFWIGHAIWGLNPLPYHLVTVALHGACAVLLWRVLLNLRVPGAWLGATLWALHPVQVESVAWISETKNTQSGFFFLLTILFFVRWLRTGKRGFYVLTLIFSVMAMASKPSTVVLPLVLCLVAWWVEGRWQWRNLTRVAPLFLLSLAAGAQSIWTQKMEANITPLPVQGWPERLITAGDSVWFYLGKLIWPHPLITIYPRWKIDAAQPVDYLPLLILVGFMIVLWIYRRTWSRPWFFALAYYLIMLLPVMDLMDMNYFIYSFVADRFQYLADMGPFALIGAGLVKLGERAVPGKVVQSVFTAGLVLVLALTSWSRAWVYVDASTLWTDTLLKNPQAWPARDNQAPVRR